MSIKTLYKTIIVLSITGLVLANFSLAQEPKIEAPETIEEAKGLVEKFVQKVIELLPQILEKLWKEEILPVWKKMFEIFSDWWTSYIRPWFEKVWQRILKFLGKEIEKRKPIIEEELEKEKEELKEEIKIETEKAKESLWQRFKNLIK